MMIAHIINQFVEKSTDFIELKNSEIKQGVLFIWQRLISFFANNPMRVTHISAFLRWTGIVMLFN